MRWSVTSSAITDEKHCIKTFEKECQTMNENKGVMESLGEYMTEIFDKDGDGIVTIKEVFTVFPNSAIAIAVIFVDLLVAIAEYRVWDFGMTVTGDGWK